MEPLLTTANVLYVLAYFVRGTLWLRALSLGGTSCLIVYFLSLPQPLMQVVYWNVLYAVINAAWIGRLLLQLGVRRQACGARRQADKRASKRGQTRANDFTGAGTGRGAAARMAAARSGPCAGN